MCIRDRGNTVVIVPGGNLEVDENGDIWNGVATTLSPTTLAPTTPAPAETIAFAGDESQFINIVENGGVGEISYATTPTAGLILSANNVTTPAWVTINSYQDSNTFGPELNFTVAVNLAGARTGTITISHPSNAGATDSMTIYQVANAGYGQGCTDPNADNYDPNAVGDDGSCTYCANFAKSGMTATNPSAPGAADGSFTMTATGGSNNYSFNVYDATNDATANPNAMAAGTYYSIVFDVTHGCQARHDFTFCLLYTSDAADE